MFGTFGSSRIKFACLRAALDIIHAERPVFVNNAIIAQLFPALYIYTIYMPPNEIAAANRRGFSRFLSLICAIFQRYYIPRESRVSANTRERLYYFSKISSPRRVPAVWWIIAILYILVHERSSLGYWIMKGCGDHAQERPREVIDAWRGYYRERERKILEISVSLRP